MNVASQRDNRIKFTDFTVDKVHCIAINALDQGSSSMP